MDEYCCGVLFEEGREKEYEDEIKKKKRTNVNDVNTYDVLIICRYEMVLW